MIPDLKRADLYKMSTTELYALAGEVTALHERIKGELMARGDY